MRPCADMQMVCTDVKWTDSVTADVIMRTVRQAAQRKVLYVEDIIVSCSDETPAALVLLTAAASSAMSLSVKR